MSGTDELIQRLSGELQPVKRLAPPLWRAARLIIGATILIAVLVTIRGLREDFAKMSADPAYWVQLSSAWVMGATATLAALNISLPDRSRFWMLLPLPVACLWATGFVYGCLGDWVDVPFGAPIMHDSASCLLTITLTGVPLALALWMMLRRAKPLDAKGTAWMGGIAIAGFADTAHLLINMVEASLLILIINMTPATIIVLLLGMVGRRRLGAVGG
ncbi:MAG TPA: NrsF family protein [Stellaceae bacterium]|nr:NrsF family protein [Stellaceae bacterium]